MPNQTQFSDAFIESAPRWMLRRIAESCPMWWTSFVYRRMIVHIASLGASAAAAAKASGEFAAILGELHDARP